MSDKGGKDPKIFGVDVGLMLLTLIENIRKTACFRYVQIAAPLFLISFVASCEDARTREIRKSAISEIERVELETIKYHYLLDPVECVSGGDPCWRWATSRENKYASGMGYPQIPPDERERLLSFLADEGLIEISGDGRINLKSFNRFIVNPTATLYFVQGDLQIPVFSMKNIQLKKFQRKSYLDGCNLEFEIRARISGANDFGAAYLERLSTPPTHLCFLKSMVGPGVYITGLTFGETQMIRNPK